MAIIYDAVLRPSKTEIVTGWARTQSWFVGDPSAVAEPVASFRFDDPEGEVGIETLLVRFGTGPLLQVALTYRGAPREGGEAWLISTMTHSVLGDRWVYDAAGDPVYLALVADAALSGGCQADQFKSVDETLIPLALTATVQGNGTPGTLIPAISAPIVTVSDADSSVATTDAVRITLMRVLHEAQPEISSGTATLSGRWALLAAPELLATVAVLTS
jgi:hypothetical protein